MGMITQKSFKLSISNYLNKGDNVGEVIKLLKSGENLIIAIPIAICENLNLKEGSEVEIEPFICGGETGARIKLKKDREAPLPM